MRRRTTAGKICRNSRIFTYGLFYLPMVQDSLWLPRSPDLSPCRGHLKQLVYSQPINSVEELTRQQRYNTILNNTFEIMYLS
jgi:hypothetical protein